jgi:hypothetical protein
LKAKEDAITIGSRTNKIFFILKILYNEFTVKIRQDHYRLFLFYSFHPPHV